MEKVPCIDSSVPGQRISARKNYVKSIQATNSFKVEFGGINLALVFVSFHNSLQMLRVSIWT